MNAIFYNNSIAKLILWKGFSTIMLFGFVLTKKSKKEMSAASIRHEQIHQYQYVECMIVGLLLALFPTICCSAWWISIVPFFYYIIYLSEWLFNIILECIKNDYNSFQDTNTAAYYAISMEQEAYENQSKESYLQNRRWFAWLSALGATVIFLLYAFILYFIYP